MNSGYDFEHYLMAGHGRAYMIAKADPEKYCQEIMEICGKDYTFDMQAEGSRAFLTYDLISLYENPEPFITVAEKSFMNPDIDKNWKQISYLSDLLALFDRRKIIIDKYRYIERQLYSNVPLTDLIPLCESFEYLAIKLIRGRSAKVLGNVMRDIGRWFLSRPEDITELWPHFLWFDNEAEEEFGKDRYSEAIKATEDSDGVREYIRVMSTSSGFERKGKKNRVTAEVILSWIREDPKIERLEMMCRGLMTMDASEAEKLAKHFNTETDPDIKASIASVFTSHKYLWPLDVSILMDCTISDNSRLAEQINAALSLLKDDRLHDYARDVLEKGFDHSAITMLIRNFRKEDESLIFQHLEGLPITYDNEDIWHEIVFAILDSINTIDFPSSFLYWAYEASLCSQCRESIVDELIKRKELPESYKEEMKWDANLDIRALPTN